MESNQVKATIESTLPGSQVSVDSDDGRHFSLVVVSPDFAGLSAVKKQQMVYAALQAAIADGSIHAVQMKTYTPEEWSALQA